MAVKWIQGCKWVKTDDSYEPRYRLSGGGIGSADTPSAQIAETRVVVWQRPMTADSDIPDSPVNPGNYSPIFSRPTGGGGWTGSETWICLDRGTRCEYGSASSKMYYETWQFSQDWRGV